MHRIGGMAPGRRILMALLVASALLGVAVVGGAADAKRGERPAVIALPDGFQPEGIAAHHGTFYVGSIPTGAIYRGSLRTGEGAVLVPAREGVSAIGLSLSRGMLFAAGGETGAARVYDAGSGAELASFQLTTGETFINDVVATREAAYFTDSVNPVIHRVAIEPGGSFGVPEAIPINGELVYEDGFNANGIDASRDGDSLVVVQSNTGELFEVDPATGDSAEIDLGGESVVNGDGILLEGGRRLYVVRNRDNLVVEIRLEADLSAGTVTRELTHESFDVPTTIAGDGRKLALVNARFGNPAPETAEYWVTQTER